MALPLFAGTLFVSAFLLFLVQPMIGKMILPKLGGTPQVWNTCMLFFQSALLAGYAYTHTVSTRLSLRNQLMIHGLLLFAPLVILFAMGQPFNVDTFVAPAGANPIWYTLGYLALIVGLPFFVVSTSAPLLQKWFGGTGHPAAADPYFLYGASNFGSLLALLAYPFVVEPFVTLNMQTWVWAGGYVVLMGFVYACAAMVWSAPDTHLDPPDTNVDVPPSEIPAPPAEVVTAIKPAPSAPRFTPSKKGKGQFRHGAGRPEPAIAIPAEPARPDVVDLWRRLRWITLSFVPSSLMLGVITYVSVDLSPFPLLWIIPLALYLASFVLVFLRWPVPWTEFPHTVVGFVYPICVLGLAYIALGIGGFRPLLTTFFMFLTFFGVALYCHGELARDRPSPRYLTDFYLCMSVGGMLGGLFNGLLAPVWFTGVAELPIVLVVACFTRPKNPEGGWLDRWLTDSNLNFGGWVRDRGDELATSMGKTPPRSIYLLSGAFDLLFPLFILALTFFVKSQAMARDGWGWADGLHWNVSIEKNPLFRFWRAMGVAPQSAASYTGLTFNLLVYAVPMLFCFFFATRRVRFGLALGAFLYANLVLLGRDENYLFAGRSYFGVLRVFERGDFIRDQDISTTLKTQEGKYTSMMHGTTLHGQNYFSPPQLGRIATTYYHRLGPVGVVMEKYNWFYGPQTTQDTFWADNRMAVGMVGLAAAPLGVGTLPLDQLVHTWSEPPYATVGLGTGTMASYARPFQHMTYYEIDQTVRNFSLPPSGTFMREDQPFFTYLKGALDRGVNLEVVMGDARQTMQKELPQEGNKFTHNGKSYGQPIPDRPDLYKRDKYYKVMVIDAFSSDAIPVHLLTYEAVKLYSDKLAEDGVLCIHTSNRHLDLVKPVVDIATKLGMKYKYGNDNRDGGTLGHTGSNYVMLAWKDEYLKFSQDPASRVFRDNKVGWVVPPSTGQYLWTDDYSNIVSVIR